ncbi:hypothetical protein CCMA1212_000938 [Trichoderma ghanense]|uniref:Uncharacterized protein n=1 Tax=Trichoderma ghanense TaxID=65468 RepID=A0ABY2HHW1_9HYPO
MAPGTISPISSKRRPAGTALHRTRIAPHRDSKKHGSGSGSATATGDKADADSPIPDQHRRWFWPTPSNGVSPTAALEPRGPLCGFRDLCIRSTSSGTACTKTAPPAFVWARVSSVIACHDAFQRHPLIPPLRPRACSSASSRLCARAYTRQATQTQIDPLAVALPFLDGSASYCSRLTAAAAALPISIIAPNLPSQLAGSISISIAIATVIATATFDFDNIDPDPIRLHRELPLDERPWLRP